MVPWAGPGGPAVAGFPQFRHAGRSGNSYSGRRRAPMPIPAEAGKNRHGSTQGSGDMHGHGCRDTDPPEERRAGRVAMFGIATAAAMASGVVATLLLPAWPGWPWFAAALVAGLLLWGRGGHAALVPAGALLAGLGWCGLHALHAMSLQLPPEFERADVQVVGRVEGLPVHGEERTWFGFRVDRDPRLPAHLRGRLLRLSWYDGWQGVDERRFEVAPGGRWRFTVRLRAPRGLRNPGWYDSEKHALANRVAATGYVRAQDGPERLSPGGGVDAWRDVMARRIAHALPGASSRYVRALALGDTRGLQDADWEALRATGLTHLIAISGFHVGMVAGFVALLVAGVWWCLPALARHVPRPQASGVAALAGALGYAAVAGFALPTVRTVLMIAVVVLARLSRSHVGVAQSLALAAIVVLAFDPLSVLGAGFWLSYAGVAWLAWCMPVEGALPLPRAFLLAQTVATLGLLPLTVLLFGQASLAGPLANLVAIPWWSLVVVPLSLAGTALEALHAGWGTGLWRAAAWCFDLAWPLFDMLARSRFALWWLPEARWFAFPLAVAGTFWILLPRGVPGKPLAALLLLPLLWPDRQLPGPGEAEVVVFDVGQGLSVLVRTQRHAVLYDAGPRSPHGFDAGEQVVVPALHALGVRRLDAVVIGHGDADHAGGFGAVARRFDPPAVFAARGARIAGAAPCLAGTRWEYDGVEFRFLHPDVYFPELGNESSCVLRVASRHGAVLLPGDIGEVVERLLARAQPDAVRADVVLMAHHGSRGSSDFLFLRATGARLALASAGHGNRFGHPHVQALERWQRAGAAIRSTHEAGALRVRLGHDGIRVEARRDTHRRPWDAEARLRRLQPGAAGVSYRPD